MSNLIIKTKMKAEIDLQKDDLRFNFLNNEEEASLARHNMKIEDYCFDVNTLEDFIDYYEDQFELKIDNPPVSSAKKDDTVEESMLHRHERAQSVIANMFGDEEWSSDDAEFFLGRVGLTLNDLYFESVPSRTKCENIIVYQETINCDIISQKIPDFVCSIPEVIYVLKTSPVALPLDIYCLRGDKVVEAQKREEIHRINSAVNKNSRNIRKKSEVRKLCEQKKVSTNIIVVRNNNNGPLRDASARDKFILIPHQSFFKDKKLIREQVRFGFFAKFKAFSDYLRKFSKQKDYIVKVRVNYYKRTFPPAKFLVFVGILLYRGPGKGPKVKMKY